MSLLALLVPAIALGAWLGGRAAIAPAALRHGHTFMFGAIGLLLFCMGLSIGGNAEIVSRMGTIGLKALSLSLAGGCGATGSVALVRRLWRRCA
jgi:hypothetical protein